MEQLQNATPKPKPEMSRIAFKVQTITLSRIPRPDGCVMPDTYPVVAAAVTAAAGPSKARQGFPRFCLQVDGERLRTDRQDILRKWLESVAIGSTCTVFRNGGKGATIQVTA